ncbi:MAG: hypothetical protein ACI9ZV_000179 [Candidatus Azotimanducaceae bacterium]|jgi:hypothetical protein
MKSKGNQLFGLYDLTLHAKRGVTETMSDANYSLELLLRVITVSLETNKIVKALPKLEID